MEAPLRIRPRTLADYFEVLTKAVFQTGIRWRVVEAKWEGFREALHGFDAAWVASLTPSDVDRLTQDPRLIRNRRKIEATVDNAETMLALDREHGGFKRFLRSHSGFEDTAADLKKHFRFVGDLGAYYFLWVVGEKVPPHEEWAASHGMRPHSGRRAGRPG